MNYVTTSCPPHIFIRFVIYTDAVSATPVPFPPCDMAGHMPGAAFCKVVNRLRAVSLSVEFSVIRKHRRRAPICQRRAESGEAARKVDCGQTREICEKQEKYLKGNVFTFTVKCLILYQYPVDLLTFLNFTKKVLRI